MDTSRSWDPNSATWWPGCTNLDTAWANSFVEEQVMILHKALVFSLVTVVLSDMDVLGLATSASMSVLRSKIRVSLLLLPLFERAAADRNLANGIDSRWPNSLTYNPLRICTDRKDELETLTITQKHPKSGMPSLRFTVFWQLKGVISELIDSFRFPQNNYNKWNLT